MAQIKDELQKAGTDAQRLDAYNKIFLHFEYANPDSVIFYMNEGLSVFTSHKYKKGIAGMLSMLGGTYSTEGMLEIAKKTANEALDIYTGTNDREGIANINNVLGVIEGRSTNYSEATKHFFIALKIYESIKDTNAITDTYIKLGAANEMSGNFEKALEYYNKGLSLLNGKPVSDVTIFLHNNIGNIYFQKNDYTNAVSYLLKALNESEGPAYAQIHILPLQNLGDVYGKMGDTARAISYCEQALAIAAGEHLPEDNARILITIANLKLNKDPDSAIVLLDNAFQTAKRIGEKNIQAEVLKSLIAIYKKKGNYKEAISLLEEEKDLSDSILNINKARAVANVEALYQLDKLNSKIQQLELSQQKQQQKKNGIFIIAILLTVFLYIVIMFLWKTGKLNTELNNREIRLQKASLVKNKLISIIAHDLIGSIRFMPLALRLCKDETIPIAEKNALLTNVEQNAIASFETLQNMLDWGKAQIQGIVLNQSNISVEEISKEVLQFINIAAGNKMISIKNNISPGITVFADPNHFRFIFRNLLSNAIKYTSKNGEITISTEISADGSYVIFSVKDNGVGVSDEMQKSIFEMPGNSTTGTDNEKGNGIGLQLCKEFVIENGGEIWMESELNKGSAFYFSLKAKKLLA